MTSRTSTSTPGTGTPIESSRRPARWSSGDRWVTVGAASVMP